MMSLVTRRDLAEENEKWGSFVEALTLKFVPKNFLSVKEKLLQREMENEQEKNDLRSNARMYNAYR